MLTMNLSFADMNFDLVLLLSLSYSRKYYNTHFVRFNDNQLDTTTLAKTATHTTSSTHHGKAVANPHAPPSNWAVGYG